MAYQSDSGDQTGQEPEPEPYGFMERELIFKLLASHALVDAEFYDALRFDARSAAAQLHILLTDDDVRYIQDVVEWDTIDKVAPDIRERLHLDQVTHSW